MKGPVKKLLDIMMNDIAFVDELYFRIRQKKPVAEDYDRRIRPLFDEIIEKGNAEQRAFAEEMNKGRACCAFAGEWTKQYRRSARIITDKSCGMDFTLWSTRSHGRKRMYLRKQWEKTFSRNYIRGLLMEQDIHSPHFYFTDTVLGALKNGGTMLDMGVAEGNFTLEFIDDADRVYLFEPDSEWHEPLKHTFADYRDKIVLCDRFVSDRSNENSVSVDEYFGGNIPTDIKLIKMDIEGYEQNALNGMKKTLEKNPDAVLLICVYHRQYAEDEIREILSQYGGYDIKVREGYMFFSEDPELAFPYIRHGIIECVKSAIR